MCWLVAQLLDAKSSHRDIKTLFPTSHQVDCKESVLSPRDKKEGELRALARMRIRRHARRGDRQKFPRIAYPPSHARAKSALIFSVLEEQVKTL